MLVDSTVEEFNPDKHVRVLVLTSPTEHVHGYMEVDSVIAAIAQDLIIYCQPFGEHVILYARHKDQTEEEENLEVAFNDDSDDYRALPARLRRLIMDTYTRTWKLSHSGKQQSGTGGR